MKKNILALFLFLFSCVVQAHIGSPNIVSQIQAGKYRLMVQVVPPDVIPGTAQVTVFVENGNPTRILARPIYFRSGDEGAPSADSLTQVQPSQYQGDVWFMEDGSSSVQLSIEDPDGATEAIVPLVAVSTAQRNMPASLGWFLSGLALLLVVLMVTTIGASVSDGLLKPNESLTSTQKRKRLINVGIATAICVLILYGGKTWWDAWASDYRKYLYKPLSATTQIITEGDQRLLQFSIATENAPPATTVPGQRRRSSARIRRKSSSRSASSLSYLIADHGKLMHLFLVRTPSFDAFAHLHPARKDTATFEAYLPKLPAGKYLVYADIVQRSGFAETIVDTVDIPAIRPKDGIKKTDTEDTYVVTDPIGNPKQIPLDENVVICGQPGTKTKLKDGSTVVWEGKPDQPFEAGKLTQLTFEVLTPDGKAADLQPYLGMAGHAAIVRSDGSVYIHLHPVGTFAMAAEQTLKKRIAETSLQFASNQSPVAFRDSIDHYLAQLKAMPTAERESFLMKEMGMGNTTTHNGMKHSNRLVFPYIFPKEGQYRIFVQIKRNNQVLTGVFDARVK